MTPLTNIPSQIEYEFIVDETEDGGREPVEIGRGAFARVLKAWQRTHRNRVREVAIKILRDDATFDHEELFEKEIELVKELNATGSVNIVSALDIIELPPLVMCASGQLYMPHCPECGLAPLKRSDPPDAEHPVLSCASPDCDLKPLSPKYREELRKLFSARAKPFEIQGPLADRGTIVNFVHRKALVMELLASKLPEYLTRRRGDLFKSWRALGWSGDEAAEAGVPTLPTARRGLGARLVEWWRPDDTRLVTDKVLLLEKLLMMAQLAESVAWLHSDQRKIVHKDLAPDNVMVHSIGGVDSVWRGRDKLGGLEQDLDQRMTYPTTVARLIDFGLADQGKLTQSWYEKETPGGNIKSPYMSPEAERRLTALHNIDFDHTGQRFRLANLRDIREGDIIADLGQPNHEHDITILRIEAGAPGEDGTYVYFEGEPDRSGNARFVHIPLLGEAHDIFALGALFYFILTDGDEDHVRALRRAAVSIEGEVGSSPLTVEYLRDQTGYGRLHRAIREPYYRDELMQLIMRMMIRGAENSFLASRTQRGPEAAQHVLHAIKGLHHKLMQDLLAAKSRGQGRRGVAAAAGLFTATTVALRILFGPL